MPTPDDDALPSIDPAQLAAVSGGAADEQVTMLLQSVMSSIKDLAQSRNSGGGDQPLSIVGGLDTANAEDEFETFAVKPNTSYWLWIAASDGATGQPATYDRPCAASRSRPDLPTEGLSGARNVRPCHAVLARTSAETCATPQL